MNDAAKIAALESTVATLQANMTSLSITLGSAITAAVADTTELKGSVDTFYLLYSGALVFFMQARVTRAARQPHPVRISLTPPTHQHPPCAVRQAGFGVLEAGSVRVKNTRNILLKNLLDACALSPSAPAAQPTPGTRGAHRPSWHACAQVRRRVHLVGVGLRHCVPHRRRRRQPVHRAARQGPRLRRLGAQGRVEERRRLRQLVVPM